MYDKTKVSKVVDSVGGTTQYEYDSMGRISKEKDSSGNILRSFSYDTYGQLVRENNAELDKTFVFEYNNNGGITKVKEYAYSTSSTPTGTATEKTNTYDSTYPDRLTKCGSTSISYNSMGCPTTCNGYTATWTRGKLSKLSKGLKTEGMHTYNYTYNAFGQRIGINYVYTAGTSSSSAVVMGMLTSYSHTFRYDQSGRLICESKTSQYYGEGSGTEKKVCLYDESGIIGMVYTSESGTTTTYYFQRNLLGDVIGIYTTSGTKVGGYAYDAWGNCTITLNTNGIAARNPIRYRSYYYDEATKLYYLNARYYNPEWRRFISPDDTAYLELGTPNGINLYVYCNNDPVNYADPSRCIAISTIIIGCLAAFAVGSAVSAVSQGLQYGWNEISVGQALIDGAFAAASVALAATGIPFIASVGVGAAMGFGQYAIGAAFHNEAMTLQGAIISTVLGGIGGAVSGAGAKNLSTLASIYDDMTGRAAQGVKALITAAQRYGLGSKQFALVNNLYGKAIQSAVNQGIKKAFVGATIKIIDTTVANPFVSMGTNSVVDFLTN